MKSSSSSSGPQAKGRAGGVLGAALAALAGLCLTGVVAAPAIAAQPASGHARTTVTVSTDRDHGRDYGGDHGRDYGRGYGGGYGRDHRGDHGHGWGHGQGWRHGHGWGRGHDRGHGHGYGHRR